MERRHPPKLGMPSLPRANAASASRCRVVLPSVPLSEASTNTERRDEMAFSLSLVKVL